MFFFGYNGGLLPVLGYKAVSIYMKENIDIYPVDKPSLM